MNFFFSSSSTSFALRFVAFYFAMLMHQMHALLVFVVDETGHTFPFEPSPTATVGDLAAEIASVKDVHPDQIAISFQGERLTDCNALLSDTGISNECTLAVGVIDPIIQLQSARENCSDVLQWDTSKDFSQIARLDQMCQVAIDWHNQHGKWLRRIVYTVGGQTASSHSFFIAPSKKVETTQEQLDGVLPGTLAIMPQEWDEPQYAKDLLLIPPPGHVMQLAHLLWNHGAHIGPAEAACYQFPPGYGLLLRYLPRNESADE